MERQARSCGHGCFAAGGESGNWARLAKEPGCILGLAAHDGRPGACSGCPTLLMQAFLGQVVADLQVHRHQGGWPAFQGGHGLGQTRRNRGSATQHPR